jgi:phosphomannomutase
MISFGTDGWRAVIADTFTFANLRLVAQAAADSINEQHTGNDQPSVVIGYDTRFLSDRFAMETARVMAGNGIIAWLSRADVPTPAISYNVVEKGADAGIVITASHNPPRYNGFQAQSLLRRFCYQRDIAPRRTCPQAYARRGARTQYARLSTCHR